MRKAHEDPAAKIPKDIFLHTQCQHVRRAQQFLAEIQSSTGIMEHLAPEHNKCFCNACWPESRPDTIRNRGSTPYVVPRGWVRFGLKVPPQAHTLDIWDSWSTSFHGIRNQLVLQSVLQHGHLMKPGDTLLDGSTFFSSKCTGRHDRVFYTSPTIKYAGLKFYAEPQQFGGLGLLASMVLQCRQRPGSFKAQGETMRFESHWPTYLKQECPHVDLQRIEWLSECNTAAVPYGLLIRTFGESDGGYRSPVDSYSWS